MIYDSQLRIFHQYIYEWIDEIKAAAGSLLFLFERNAKEKFMRQKIRRFLAEYGQDLVEYGQVIVVVTILVFAVLWAFDDQLIVWFHNMNTSCGKLAA